MAAIKGTKVRTSLPGKVLNTNYNQHYGKNIIIKHNDKFKTKYAHLSTILVAAGDEVEKNKIIGIVGDTGTVRSKGSDATHLHFEIYKNNKAVNPLEYLNHNKYLKNIKSLLY